MSQQPKRTIKGAGGPPKAPPTPTQTPDNLRSEDYVELVLGVTEGPWKGLTDGAKSLQIGDTILERQDGERNFDNVEYTIYPGEAFPETMVYKLGGAAANNTVGVATSYGIPLTRQTEHGNIDAIDVRLVVNQLMKSVEEGKNPGIFDHTFNFRIKYKPYSAAEWVEWGESAYMLPQSGNPTAIEYSTWSPGTTFDGTYWTDPVDGKSWSLLEYIVQAIWAKDQRDAQVGLPPAASGLNISGKTTSAYVKEYRIPVQRIPEPYMIQVERITPDSSLSGDPKYYAEVTWESFQTIDLSPQKFPYTGMLQFYAKSTDQFTSIPQISGEGDGLIVKVPTNFNPETRQYTGTWDGLFKEAWTNSPVWLLYEAIHNDRWGWSAYTDVSWSRYEAYALAQITDHILPSGKPRYTFNAYLTDPMDGREFCRYLAGSFNSVIVDDDNGHVRVLMDKDDPAVAIFGPESIIGDFEYTYTDVNTRYNDLTVVFRNPEIDYNEDRRGIKDDASIAQHGRIPFDFIAVGTTDQNEAVRKASRRLVSATTETEMVNFRTNRKAQFVSPYDIILVTDPYKGYGQSGRFKSFSGTTVTLRDPIYLETGVTYSMDIESNAGMISRTVSGTTGWNSILTLNSALPSGVPQKAQFSLGQSGGAYGLPKPYRILDIKLDEEPDSWSIMAIEVNRLKFAAEDDAQVVGEPRYTFPIQREPASPENLKITNISRAAPDGTMIYEARVDFTAPADPYVDRYFIRYRQEGQTEYEVVETDGSGLVVSLPRDGEWEFQARSRNIWNQQSLWIDPAITPINIDKDKAIAGGGISAVTGGVNNITIKVNYPDQTDIRYARIYENTTNNNVTATFVGKTDSDTYVRTGLIGVVNRYYWVRFEDNLENIGPYTSSGGVMGTTTQITAPDISPGAITLEKFATGVTPVEIVSALPSTGNFLGRTVVLTTDGKLYNWNGTAWVRTAPDPIGTGVETVAVLPTTGNFEGRVVFLTTDDKLYTFRSPGGWLSTIPTTDLTGTITGPQIAPGAITIDRLATGLTAVEIVATLPTTGNFTGRTVVLTTDGKLYRYSGSSFTNAVPTSDLTGTITAAQIAANTITSAQIAANTITSAQIAAGAIVASNIAAGAITATKLAVMDQSNAITDPTFNDPAYWNLVQQSPPWTINSTDTSALTALASPRVLKSGAPSGTTHAAKYDQAYMSTPVPFEAGGKPARASISYQVTAGFTGILRVYLYQYNYAGTYVGAIFVGASNDYRTVAASTATTGTITAIVDLAATTGALTIGVELQRSPTLNNAGYMYLASPRISRAINAELIVDGTITGTKIAADTITATQIAANAITTSELAAGSVTAAKIVAGTITANEIAGATITGNKIVAGTITAANIATGTLTATQIQSASITGDRLVANTITAGQITAGTITATQIAVGTIVADRIASGTITGDRIAANTIAGTNIIAGAITAVEIAANAITSTQIAAGAITATKIATGAITADMIGAGTISVSVNVGSSGKILLDGANNRIIISD